ncbi:hypothetical protein PGB28_08290 [Primorskyibacter aestuariivivens]|nr:hypothetical protein [Primorskyibacter aestuariivivens]MDA7428456.1 hypothetical protein [Primorskyibacter aestuariivivens]
MIIFTMLAFVAGMLFERAHQKELCSQSGGQWLQAGYCGEK